MKARIKLQNTELKKSGHNKFAGYKYFELGDFLPTVQNIFIELGLCGVVSYTQDLATLTIADMTSDSTIVITSPMGSAALKGCHEVQNVGAVETYQRRYLWVTAMEIVEHDVLDAVTGTDTGTPAKKPELELKQPEFNDEEKDILHDLADSFSRYVASEHISEAKQIWTSLDNDQKLFMWGLLDSKTRSTFKKYQKGE